MNLWDGSGCSGVRRWRRTRLRSYTDNTGPRRNVLHHGEELLTQHIPPKHRSNSSGIHGKLTGR